jgi:hypothetical protein
MPLFRRGPADKPDWGKPASYVAYHEGYIAGYAGSPSLTDPETMRLRVIDASGEDIRSEQAEHLYTSGYRDGKSARATDDGPV